MPAGFSERKMGGMNVAASNRKTTTSAKKTTENTKKQTAASAQRSNTGRNSGGKNGAGKSTGSAKRETVQRPQDGGSTFMGKEITILIAFAICVLLFLSNLGLCGSVGTFVFELQRGCFGLLGYLFPIGLFVGVLFFLSNRYDGRAMAKLAASVFLFLVVCGLLGLLTSGQFDSAATVREYYELALTEWNGGAVGGIFLKLLCPTIGKIGAYIVLILLATIAIVFITEKSVLQPLGRSSRKAYHTVREETVRRHEEHVAKAEERKRYRMEKKVSGVATDTVIGDVYIENGEEDFLTDGIPVKEQGSGPAAAGRDPAAAKDTADPADRVIPVRGYRMTAGRKADQAASQRTDPPLSQQANRTVNRTTSQAAQPEGKTVARQTPQPEMDRTVTWQPEADQTSYPEERPAAQTIPVSGDVLIPKKDTRTLSELEALDSLKGNIFSERKGQPVWKEDLTKLQGTEQAGQTAGLSDRQPACRTDNQTEPDEGDDWSSEDAWKQVQRETEKAEQSPRSEADEPDMDLSQNIWNQTMKSVTDTSRWDAIPAEEENDIKRVVTANGKIIEVEIDPDDDPLERKRMENRLAKRRAEQETAEAAEPFTVVRGSAGGAVALHGRAGQDPDYVPEDIRRSEDIAANYSTVGRSAETPAHGASREEKPRPYIYPPTTLMKAGDHKLKNQEEGLQETARKLESTLQSFGVGVTVTNISCGPAVTQYELQPEPGVRVNKIQSLADDIQLNLAAADIRIEAPIPGKASIGIEVPNKEIATVFLRDVLESQEFRQHPAKTAFAVGMGMSGDTVVTDLAKMPHLLIAGATGSGKSVCINTLIMSVLYKASPEEVRLIMIDPKVVELSVYNGIPHLMIPVVTDPKKAAGALNWAVAEMTDRYRRFADCNVRDLKGYNEKLRQEAQASGEEAKTLPQIIIIVDELADLMMVSPSDVEDAICRLAQMARAAGLHLVLATQRPTVNVITGLIKANVPSRIAFSVSSGVDSRTIIDMNGAEKLLGKGDMLFYPSGFQKPVRVQGAFVSDAEVSDVVEYVKSHNTAQTYSSAIEAQLASMDKEEAAGTAAAGNTNHGRDEYFAEAGRFIIDKQKASIGMLQRVFKIGFNRAARIMDQLAEVGVVSEDAGTKAREILMDMAQFESLLSELGMQ